MVVSRVLRAACGGVVAVLVAGCAGSGGAVAGGGESPTPGASPSAASHGVAPATTALRVGRSAWVSVSVATLWRSPSSPRPVDAPALGNPAAISRWLGSMSVLQRRDLAGRADTQSLLGDRVVVLALPAGRPRWAKVAVPDQPTPLNSLGYPGWVPRRQLTGVAPAPAARVATVVVRTAWLRADDAAASRLFRVSLGTTLPVRAVSGRFVRVVPPGGPARRLSLSAVAVHAAGTPALAPTRAGLVRTATSFVGLPYLWAGVSGFGLDCSGLTWLVYRVHGIRIPRDAAPQSRSGHAVATPRPGDLMFYRSAGVVHHVSMYVGHGRMVHSPRTGLPVQVVPTSTPPWPQEYAGARGELG